MSKKKILFLNYDLAGVFYYRTQLPAVELDKNHSSDFEVDVRQEIDWNDDEYLKSLDIIHFHRTLIHDDSQMERLVAKLKSFGITLVMDIDDFWRLQPTHPLYYMSLKENLAEKTISTLKLADYVTTTTKFLANEIRKHNPNVMIFENAINPEESQWKPKKKESEFVRFGYLAGSSHMHDIEMLRGATNLLRSNLETKDKFKIFLCGWDKRGSTTQYNLFPQELVQLLQQFNINTQETHKQIMESGGDLDKIKKFPQPIKDMFRGKLPVVTERNITPRESVWYQYEKLLTDEYKIIKTKEYFDFLMKFDNSTFPGQENEQYERVFTKPITSFGNGYNNFDITLSPVFNSHTALFNKAKSNLKIVESGFHKNAIIVSEIECYDEIVHGKNGMVVRTGRNNDWGKFMKKLIMEPALREDISENLHEMVMNKYNITNITNKRAEFYNQIRKTVEV
jgi:glycosyltransferase involved in cell wall biosynthesis